MGGLAPREVLAKDWGLMAEPRDPETRQGYGQGGGSHCSPSSLTV